MSTLTQFVIRICTSVDFVPERVAEPTILVHCMVWVDRPNIKEQRLV